VRNCKDRNKILPKKVKSWQIKGHRINRIGVLTKQKNSPISLSPSVRVCFLLAAATMVGGGEVDKDAAALAHELPGFNIFFDQTVPNCFSPPVTLAEAEVWLTR
jgi:hypothetical protein